MPTLSAAASLHLRPWTPDDIDFVLEAAADAAINRYSSVGTATSVDAATAWIASRSEADRLDWVITNRGTPVGRVSLAHINHADGVAEVGYWVLPAHRRQSSASNAVREVERYAWYELSLARLVIRHEPENEASCAFALSRGYQAEGTERGAFERHGARRDLHVHGLLRTDPVSLE